MKLRRTGSNPKITELKRLPLFAGLGAKQLAALAQNLDEVRIPPGETVMKEGRHNDTFWILIDGEATLTLGANVREKVGRGDIVGLPSMFSGLEATANMVATSPLHAFVASHQQFNSLIFDPEVAIRFKAALFDRLRDEVYQLTRGVEGPAIASAAVKKKKGTG